MQTGGAGGLSASVSMAVAQVLSTVQFSSSVAPYYSCSGTSQKLAVPTFLDQFGNVMATPPAPSWSTSSAPPGAPAATFTTSGGATTVTFKMAGSYTLTAHATAVPSVSFAEQVSVNQAATGLVVKTAAGQVVSPTSALAVSGTGQTFVVAEVDQFGNAMAAQPAFTWSTITVPAGAGTTVAATSTGATITVYQAGSYGVGVQASGGGNFSASVSMTVRRVEHGQECTGRRGVHFRDEPATGGADVPRPVRQRDDGHSGVTWSATSSPTGRPANVHEQRGRHHGHVQDGRRLYANRPRQQRVERFRRRTGGRQPGGDEPGGQDCRRPGRQPDRGLDGIGHQPDAVGTRIGPVRQRDGRTACPFLVNDRGPRGGHGADRDRHQHGHHDQLLPGRVVWLQRADRRRRPCRQRVDDRGAGAEHHQECTGRRGVHFRDEPATGGADVPRPVRQRHGRDAGAGMVGVGGAHRCPAPTFTTSGGVTTVTFKAAGAYTLTAHASNASGITIVEQVAVSQTATSMVVKTAGGQVVSPTAALTVSAAGQTLIAAELDQFGNAMAGAARLYLVNDRGSRGGAGTAVAANGTVVTITFHQAGSYGVRRADQRRRLFRQRVDDRGAGARRHPESIGRADVSELFRDGQQLTIPTFLDQFGNVMAAAGVDLVGMSSAPADAAQQRSPPAGATTVTFGMAGSYIFTRPRHHHTGPFLCHTW